MIVLFAMFFYCFVCLACVGLFVSGERCSSAVCIIVFIGVSVFFVFVGLLSFYAFVCLNAYRVVDVGHVIFVLLYIVWSMLGSNCVTCVLISLLVHVKLCFEFGGDCIV